MDGLDQPGGEMSFVHDYLDSACDDMSQNNVDPATIAVTAVLRQLRVEWCDLVASISLAVSEKGRHGGTNHAGSCATASGGACAAGTTSATAPSDLEAQPGEKARVRKEHTSYGGTTDTR